MSARIMLPDREISDRWPHIERFLWLDENTGRVDDDYPRWHVANEKVSLPSPELAAAYEEWAAFYEWRLAQRADELARDRGKRHLVEKWTDSMTYCAQRCAIMARGEDPGEWVPLHKRRPDLDATSRSIVAEIIAELDARPEHQG